MRDAVRYDYPIIEVCRIVDDIIGAEDVFGIVDIAAGKDERIRPDDLNYCVYRRGETRVEVVSPRDVEGGYPTRERGRDVMRREEDRG